MCSAHAGRNRGAGAPRGNANRLTHGFYGRYYTPEEIADLVAHAMNESLLDEIATTRIGLRRVLQHSQQQLPPEYYALLAGLLFTGANTIGRLIRTQRAISGQSADGVAAAIAQSIDELATFESVSEPGRPKFEAFCHNCGKFVYASDLVVFSILLDHCPKIESTF